MSLYNKVVASGNIHPSFNSLFPFLSKLVSETLRPKRATRLISHVKSRHKYLPCTVMELMDTNDAVLTKQ